MSPAAIPAVASAAVLRMQASRERLRLALRPDDPASVARCQGSPSSRAFFRDSPTGRLLWQTLEVWWQRHPLRFGAGLASASAQSLLLPLARRHPIWLMAGAVLLGAGLARSRPWRWIGHSVTAAGVLTQGVSWLLARAPLPVWLAVLGELAAHLPQGRAEPATPERPPFAPDTSL